MYIKDDEIKLSIKLDTPSDHNGKYPLVIIIHGFTGNKDERHLAVISHMLNEIGFATLRADMYGHGESGGEFRNHTLYKWISNAMTLIDYAESLDAVEGVFLCGHSQGGLTAALTAAMEKKKIRGLILLSPALHIPEAARKGEILDTSFDPDMIPDEIPTWKGLTLGGNYIRVAQTIDVGAAIDRFDKPVLLIHGEADEAVPVAYSVSAAERYSKASLEIIKDDTHCYDRHLEEAVEAVKDWLLLRCGYIRAT